MEVGDPEGVNHPPNPRRDSPRQTFSVDTNQDSSKPLNASANEGRRRSSAIDLARISNMVKDDKLELSTYEVTELRDGLFDAVFLGTDLQDHDALLEDFKDTLPPAFAKGDPLSPRQMLSRQAQNIKSAVIKLTTTRAGLRLSKAFLAIFTAYALCLVGALEGWLGPYSYIMVVSVIVNHPARSVGSQLDGLFLTCAGIAAGIGWGVVGLLLSTSTLAASTGYGGILALFLFLFMAGIGWIRAFFTRFYQATLCAGIAITFTALADTSSFAIRWSKLRSFAVAWMMGQAIALFFSTVLFPDTGSRQLAITMRQAFAVMQDALTLPHATDSQCRRNLSTAFVDLSTAYRDMRIDITITRFEPEDVRELRNQMQGVIRALLSLGRFPAALPDWSQPATGRTDTAKKTTEGVSGCGPSSNVLEMLSAPTMDLIESVRVALRTCDAALLDISGYRAQLGPKADISSDTLAVQTRIQQSERAFDSVEAQLLDSGKLHGFSAHAVDAVQLLIFTRHVREAAGTVDRLVTKVNTMQQHCSQWPRLRLPSYPFWKAIHRTNSQVRHDRGGITAGSYRTTFDEIARQLDKIKSKAYTPNAHAARDDLEEMENTADNETEHAAPAITADVDVSTSSKRDQVGVRVWRVMHRLQGFESKYAFKICLLTSLLSVPSYLPASSGWWDQYGVWWAVAMAWITMHPRVGGNFQDLVTRSFFAILGAVWSGVAYAAGNGNAVVLGVFAAIYLLPMVYRFTQSAHSRSGLIGCLAFCVISLDLHINGGSSSPTLYCTYQGLAFLVGTVSPILVNWLLWPFVARHELRNALSLMLFFMSILYRNTLGKYIYFKEGQAPTATDIRNSEILEGRLREGFIRIRQLLVMTRHEIRLAGPFDPLPYSALADSADRFFEYLIAVRQSALFYNPTSIRDNPLGAQALLSFRRDAVATVLANLYVLSGALRSKRPVPKYLPSAAAARKKLLLKTAEVEGELSSRQQPSGSNAADLHEGKEEGNSKKETWADVYSYSYNESLTGCVAQLEELEKLVKLIVGEHRFDLYKDKDGGE